MAIAFESAESGVVTDTSDVTLAVLQPSGLVVGELLAAIAGCVDARSVSAPNSGWRRVDDLSDGSRRIALFTKIANGDDVAASTFTFTVSGTFNNAALALLRISGAWDVDIVRAYATGANAQTVTCADISTLKNESLVIWGAWQPLDAGPATIASGTERVDDEHATGACWIYAATQEVSPAGIVTGPVITKTGFGEARAFSIAISPRPLVLGPRPMPINQRAA